MSETKKQTDITRDEWIVYEWLDITTMGQTERHYLRGLYRPMREAEQAGRDYDAFHAALNNLAETEAGYQPTVERTGGDVVSLADRERS